MKRSRLELYAGVFVLVGLLAIAYLAVKIGGGELVESGTYTVKARFANSGGLTKGCSVLIAGVPVGRVTALSLNSDFAAIVEMRLYQNVHLPNDTIASSRTTGLIGDKFVSLSPGSETELIRPGGMITETESAVDLESLISRFAFGTVQDNAKAPVK
jgi:phospholipid/cholesterol/gamma-HCH transport system substrate-binding protein